MGQTIAVVTSTMASGLMVMVGLMRWMSAPTEAYSIEDLKREFLGAGIEEVHHEVYAAVGETEWEEFVKPDFLRSLTLHIAVETNNAVPGPADVIRWVSEHQEQAREMLRSYKGPGTSLQR